MSDINEEIETEEYEEALLKDTASPKDKKTRLKENRKLRKDAEGAARTPEQDRAALRRKVRIFYDLQRLRMQTAGRTLERATDIELHDSDVAILDARAENLREAEKEALKDVAAHLATMPAYFKILAEKPKWKGIGPTLAGVLLSEIDINRCETVSALWRYAGLAPQKALRCKVCQDTVVPTKPTAAGSYKHEYNRKSKCGVRTGDVIRNLPGGEFIEDEVYKTGPNIPESQVYESSAAERPTKGEKLHYNKFLKTKLVGVMGSCLIKANSPWRKFYDDYKHRLKSAGKGMSDGHRNSMANRYMVKMLLQELWIQWRTLEGLPVRESYQEQYLGHKHSA
jgi:hypothetical protein